MMKNLNQKSSHNSENPPDVTPELSPEVNKRVEQIQNCSSFEELFSIIREMKTIKGSVSDYSAEELINTINEARVGVTDLSFVTNKTYKVRDAVSRLINQAIVSAQPQPQTQEAIESVNAIRIKRCNTFESLYSIIREIGTIEGNTGTFSAEELIGLINQVRTGVVRANFITNKTYGIRDAVTRILVENKISA